MRFEINGTEILDRKTGLIWQRAIEKNLTHEEALEHAEQVALETGLNWRVPTIDELSSLLDRTRSFPASGFPDMPSETFWSSLPYVGGIDLAWVVYFSYGFVSSSSCNYGYAVRLVRSNVL